jgi:hypothetical protein
MCACGGSTTSSNNQTSAQLQEQSNLSTQTERERVLADMRQAMGNSQS